MRNQTTTFSFLNITLFVLFCSTGMTALATESNDDALTDTIELSSTDTQPSPLSENDEQTTNERVLPNKNQQREQIVKRHLQVHQRSDEFVQLNALGMPFSGMYLMQRTLSPQGSVLILPDNGEHGLWPDIIAPLREALPDAGWNTLSINLLATPQPPKARYEDMPKSAEIPSDVENSKTEDKKYRLRSIEEYQQQMTARIDSGVAKLLSRNSDNLAIVAVGYSANWAAVWLSHTKFNDEDGPKVTLIMVDPTDASYAPNTLAETLPEIEAPILDLITPNSLGNSTNNQKRKGYALSNGNADYLQVHLTPVRLDNNKTNEVVRRVRGWLKTQLPAPPHRKKIKRVNALKEEFF